MNIHTGICATLLALATIGGASGCDAAPGKHLMKGRHMAATDTLTSCTPKSATLHLVPEDLLTRAAITPETIERYAPAVPIGAGDARLAQLADALYGLKLEPAALPQFELRLLVKLTCADGKTHVLTGSKTLDDGRIDVAIDGEQASSHSPLRQQLEALTKG